MSSFVRDEPFEATWIDRARIAPTPGSPGLFLALAPMDGITDWVYRELATSLFDGDSGISACVSEFVRVTRDVVPDHVLRRHCPELDRGGKTRSGVPVYVQLLGGAPEPMAGSAAAAAALGAPGIDINFGCPAKTVNNHDGGASILRCPPRVEAIVAAVRKAVPSTIAVTAKIRLGWDSADYVQDVARAAEAGGASWLTIHARTRLQQYRPPVDWVAIDRARRAIAIPVVANGDIDTVEALLACAEQSGCRAFMIGRGAMGRPHLFRAIRGAAMPEFDEPWFVATLLDYCDRLLAAGAGDHGTLGRLKQWLRLGAPAFESIARLFDATKRTVSLDDARRILDARRRSDSAAA